MILGISASGRRDGITSETVKAVLKASGQDYDYVSWQENGSMGARTPSVAAISFWRVY